MTEQINLLGYADSHESNFVFVDFFKNQKLNLLLLTHNLEKSDFLDKINSFIMEKIIELKIDEIERNNIEEVLKEFFVELNWQLYAKFRKAISKEFGLSLLLVIIYENEAFIVQFGRLLCGLLKNGKLSQIGRDWQNFAIKTKEELFLLGSKDENIDFDIYKVTLEKGSLLFALPSTEIENLEKLGINPLSLKENILTLYEKNKFPYFILKVGKSVLIRRKKLWKIHRNRILALILALVVFISAFYVFYGKNWLEEKQHILKEKNREYQNNELLEKLFETQNQLQETINEIFKQNKALEIFPNQKIELKKSWSKELPFSVKMSPFFDYKQIYLASDTEILALKKLSQKTNWKRKFPANISNINLLDANRILVILKNREIFCLNRDSGKILWQKESEVDTTTCVVNHSSYQISINKYKNLDTSIVLLHDAHSITLLNNINGKMIIRYQNSGKIDFVSEFDQLEKCIYIIEDKKISKIGFRVLS